MFRFHSRLSGFYVIARVVGLRRGFCGAYSEFITAGDFAQQPRHPSSCLFRQAKAFVLTSPYHFAVNFPLLFLHSCAKNEIDERCL